MRVKEYNAPDGDYIVEIRLSHMSGDRSRMMERNKDHNDVPLIIAYNLGSDFPIRTPDHQKQRVLAMLKMLRVAVNEAMADIGEWLGVKPPGPQRNTPSM